MKRYFIQLYHAIRGAKPVLFYRPCDMCQWCCGVEKEVFQITFEDTEEWEFKIEFMTEKELETMDEFLGW